MPLTVSKPELDTILAALRLWQGRSFGERSLDLRDNASDGNAHRLLSEDEIDERCERLNTEFFVVGPVNGVAVLATRAATSFGTVTSNLARPKYLPFLCHNR